jgi:chemotaxis receptor (MCP) glutamine deamidase CheD
VLWKNDLLINGEDAGGSKPRTLALHIGTGRVAVKSGAEIIEL